MKRKIDAGTASNRVIALALLADSQLARAIHVADDARAEELAREEERRRQEEADRAFRERRAREDWSNFDTRHRSAVEAVSSASGSLAGKRVLAGILTAVSTLVGALCCLTFWLIGPTTYLEASYFYGVYGIGRSLSRFLWLPVLLGVAAWYACRRVPAISLLSVPAIGWIVYASGPAVSPPGPLGQVFSDLVERVGEYSVLLAIPGLVAALWLIWVSSNVANDARAAQKKKNGAEASLRQVESGRPAAARPGGV